MLEKYKVAMPNQNLSDQEIREYIAYFRWADANVRPQGTTQPQPAAPGTALPPSQTLSAPGPGNTAGTSSLTEVEKSGAPARKGAPK
jgi:nitrite reductase (NO-forming)